MPPFGKTCVHKKNLIIVKEKLLAIFSSSLSHFSSKALLECIFLSILRDRFITVVNVMGDAMGTGIVQHLSRDELDEIDEKNNITYSQNILCDLIFHILGTLQKITLVDFLKFYI